MSVQAFPRPTFKVVEAEFFLELLMCLFADPARFDGAGQLLDRRVGGQVGEVVLALAGRAMFADEPDFLAWQVLSAHIVDTLRWPVCYTHTNSGEAGREFSFGARAAN
jgi:hypothetical protein